MIKKLLLPLLLAATLPAAAQDDGGVYLDGYRDRDLDFFDSVRMRLIMPTAGLCGRYSIYARATINEQGKITCLDVVDIPVKRAPPSLLQYVKKLIEATDGQLRFADGEASAIGQRIGFYVAFAETEKGEIVDVPGESWLLPAFLLSRNGVKTRSIFTSCLYKIRIVLQYETDQKQ